MTAQLALMAAFLLFVAGCGETGTSADGGPAGDTGVFDDAGTPTDGGVGGNTSTGTGGASIDAVAVSDVGPEPDATGDALAGDSANTTDCMPKVHPGTVTYVNGDTGEVRVQAVDPSNESRFWVMTAEGRIPIVKFVYRRLDDRTAEIKSFGPCDQLLEVTIGTT